MNKPTIVPPGERVRINDRHAEIGTATWFSAFSTHMADAVKKSVDAGMPAGLAEEVYKGTLSKVLPSAVQVRDAMTKKGWRQENVGDAGNLTRRG